MKRGDPWDVDGLIFDFWRGDSDEFNRRPKWMGKLSELLFCSLGNFGLQTSLAQMTVVGILG